MESKRKNERKNRKLKKARAFLALVKSHRESESTTANQVEDQGTAGTREKFQNQIMTDHNDTRAKTANNEMASKSKEQSAEEALKEMKMILREKQKETMQRPKVFLTPDDMLPYKPEPDEGEAILPPLYPIDIQHLLLYALQGNVSSFKPRWCRLLRVGKVSSVVMILLDGVGYSDFTEDKESFKFINQSFSSHMEVICPEQYDMSVDAEIVSVPLSISQLKKANVKVDEDVKKKIAQKIMPWKMLEPDVKKKVNEPPLEPDVKKEVDEPDVKKEIDEPPLPDPSSEDKFSRASLLLSSDQMKREGYPLPVQTRDNKFKGYKFSKDSYTDVTPSSPLIGLDCEMCLTTIHRSELTRVSLVGENRETIYDSLVQPRNKITNYLTQYSGITREMMKDVRVRLEDVQRDIQKLLPPDAILCGQSLNGDLNALKLFHPYVIDTSVVYNLSGNKRMKTGLKKLSAFFLDRPIQNRGMEGHCPVEDALAALDLVKLKLRRGIEFGDATISGTYFPNVQTYFLGNEKKETNQGANSNSPGHTVANSTSPLKRSHPVDEASDSPGPKKMKKNGTASGSPDPNSLESSHQEVMDSNSEDSDIKKRMLFFRQNNSMHVAQSFFQLVEEAGRTACLIGRESLTSKHEKEPIEKCTVSSDMEACDSAKTLVNQKEFTWVNFNKFREEVVDPASTKEYIGTLKRSLDLRVERVLSKVKDKSLVLLVMTGRLGEEGNAINAGTFVKIT